MGWPLLRWRRRGGLKRLKRSPPVFLTLSYEDELGFWLPAPPGVLWARTWVFPGSASRRGRWAGSPCRWSGLERSGGRMEAGGWGPGGAGLHHGRAFTGPAAPASCPQGRRDVDGGLRGIQVRAAPPHPTHHPAAVFFPEKISQLKNVDHPMNAHVRINWMAHGWKKLPEQAPEQHQSNHSR